MEKSKKKRSGNKNERNKHDKKNKLVITIKFIEKTLPASLFLALSCLVSCATTPKFDGKSEIVGKVIDSKGKGIRDCIVTLDGTKSASTNNSGIFVFRDISSGNHKISVQKENYSMEKREFPFMTRQTFLTVQCKSGKEIFYEVEDYLDQKDLSSAKATLKTLKKCDENESLYYFYEHLLDYLAKPTERRKKYLANMAKRSEK